MEQPAVLGGISLLDAERIQQRYTKERDKRCRTDGLSQYISLTSSANSSLLRLIKDPWDDGSVPSLTLVDGAHFNIVIMGAGFGGLLFAVRLLDVGFKLEDIAIVDTAAGFGGTWYWNRYPGLMCDTESYIYMPLLEETGYMPKHKYAYGQELREHANRIAKQWSLEHRAMFRTCLQGCSWSDDAAEWIVEMTQHSPPGPGCYSGTAKIHANFVILSPGIFTRPKVSDLPGLDTFQGQSFLTSRWDYTVTGGSQKDPVLAKLQNKRVGIIGTGATAVQVVPQLAKWSGQLYVFQRTPASVDTRDQRETDVDEWAREINKGPGWQNERMRNFNSFITVWGLRPLIDMVSDGWTCTPTLSLVTGGVGIPVSIDKVVEYTTTMHMTDIPRAERIRARVDATVHDKTVSEKLKAWYSSWCKRPCFHDEYLPTFNLPHVTLVDTDGKGVERITESGVVVHGECFDLDILVFSMGFEIDGLASPSRRAGVSVTGRRGQKIDEKWSQRPATLHGIMSNGFPNMFFANITQVGISPNFTSSLEPFAQHVAFLISEGHKRIDPQHSKVIIEATREAEATWVMQIRAGALALSPVASCTPSYYNGEKGMADMPLEAQMRAAAAGPWPSGPNSYMDVLQEWRDAGDLRGLHIAVV